MVMRPSGRDRQLACVRRRHAFSTLLTLVAAVSGCDVYETRPQEPPQGDREGLGARYVTAFGDTVSFELDALEVPGDNAGVRGFVAITPATRSLIAAVVVRDAGGQAWPLDELLGAARIDPVLRLRFDNGTVIDIPGRSSLTELAFDLSEVALPRGTNPEVSVLLGGDSIGGGHAVHVARMGDVDLDGAVDSSDLVTLFAAGRYETGEAASYSEGDFNADGVFDSSDLVALFGGGDYQAPGVATPSDDELDEALIVRDYPPYWLASGEVADALFERQAEVDDALASENLTTPQRDALNEQREALTRQIEAVRGASSRPDLNYNDIDLLGYEGCAVTCWLSARSIGATLWEVERTESGTFCEQWHDDDCAGELAVDGRFPMSCDPVAGHGGHADAPGIEGWLDGAHYQYQACGPHDVQPPPLGSGSSAATAECEQHVALTMHCENFGKACGQTGAGAAACDYRESREADVHIGAATRRAQGSVLAPRAEIKGKVQFSSTLESEFGVMITPATQSLTGVGIANSDDVPTANDPCEELEGDAVGTIGVECYIEQEFLAAKKPKVACKLFLRGELKATMSVADASACIGKLIGGDESGAREIQGAGTLENPVYRHLTVTTGGIAESAVRDLPLDPLGMRVENRTHAETVTEEDVHPEFGLVGYTTLSSTAQAWADVSVAATLSVDGPGVGANTVCLTARPAGLPESSFVQDHLLGAHDDENAARFGHWWGSQLSLNCDDKWSLFPLAQRLPLPCAAELAEQSVGWECKFDELCGATVGTCITPESV
ncbi:MAG: dockerin type I repeat-containing protein [Deltaproteobacteria bacterium]|nr:dockerin type I repeat-containing protein [Deltaproteobacteria bacterium]MBK8716434.1 dockerin type I repeat-containing protein [Deltaproteobacteria bacterium]MBP7292047.1 dockerin type I repeat-containing protein [Nannocystaceae bacterium]